MADQGSKKREREETEQDAQDIEDEARSPSEAGSPTSSDAGSPKRRRTEKGNPMKIGTKIYSCATCRNGHRVSKCRHLDRFLVRANKPGRPEKGEKKRIKCKCPSPQECTCTEIGYWLVYIPGPNEPKDAKPTAKQDQRIEGTFVSVKQAHLDAKGQPISDEEYNQRRQKLEASRNNTGCSRSRSASSTITTGASTSTSSASSTSQPVQDPKPQACCHKDAVAQQSQETGQPQQTVQSQDTEQPRTHVAPQVYNKLLASLSASALFHGCNCGAACSCAFCPQHPNNNVSQSLARQHANTFINHQRFNANQNFMQTPMPPPDFSQDTPCTGGTTRQTYRRGRTLPTYEEIVQEHFEDQDGNGMVMAYPVETRGTALMRQATAQNQMAMAGPPTQNTMVMPGTDMAESFPTPLATDDQFHVINAGRARVADPTMQSWSGDNLTLDPRYYQNGPYGVPPTYSQGPMAAASVDQGIAQYEQYSASNHPPIAAPPVDQDIAQYGHHVPPQTLDQQQPAAPSVEQDVQYFNPEMLNQPQMAALPMEQSMVPDEEDFVPATSHQPHMESTPINGNGPSFHLPAEEFMAEYPDLGFNPLTYLDSTALTSWPMDSNYGYDLFEDLNVVS
ncbi:hypothetical protein PMZ80_010789 [Knufia obscura]|uniref:Copper-fist domain-containing protein n=2 Tax=Knufia TaxID=430999 RepID=A0AAN8EFX9_9EURO|nr:hypothetical protein PMZ80_010789 [Knufia obscura]KAK5949827.1 hypothetical protein OHC33_009216 [Knufia fluminis]